MVIPVDEVGDLFNFVVPTEMGIPVEEVDVLFSLGILNRDG